MLYLPADNAAYLLAVAELSPWSVIRVQEYPYLRNTNVSRKVAMTSKVEVAVTQVSVHL